MTILNRLTRKSILVIDAAVCGAASLLLIAAAGPLGDLLDLPFGLIRIAGAILIPWTALLIAIGTRPTIGRAPMDAVIAGNLLWVAASAMLLTGDRVDPNPLGFAFVILQAVVVAVFALVQIVQTLEPGRNQAWTTTSRT
jgi:hypothetical protein